MFGLLDQNARNGREGLAMTLSIMDGCYRCPQCFSIPVVKLNDPMRYTLQCPEHGHMAGGDTIEKAIKHWNMYIQGLITNAPDCIRKRSETKTEKTINDAMFGIDPKEGK